ncbi:glyoxylate/hydroxypyruvate reductase hpr3 [Phtheirospermum japonicum]|uniref:Glyoxylate/hydroxypyruvate reductase hpr3 n=1 Tax=Phtheirospermum japonicum TaxID=374723 RepID=A0A830B9B2_9LAMI|nr:glyoxylate/hydroxypyruvate reductase hpr3 [Phtheirospermum japonicum]
MLNTSPRGRRPFSSSTACPDSRYPLCLSSRPNTPSSTRLPTHPTRHSRPYPGQPALCSASGPLPSPPTTWTGTQPSNAWSDPAPAPTTSTSPPAAAAVSASPALATPSLTTCRIMLSGSPSMSEAGFRRRSFCSGRVLARQERIRPWVKG